jgi:FkbM family methyltransferase
MQAGKVARTEQLAKAHGSDTVLSFAAHDAKMHKQCPLPVNATWCEVRLANLPPYMMAVRADVDVVSSEVCTKGFWETQDFATLGPPGNAMDIGGNMGYFTFALAHAGWHVITFEPMRANLDLMDATLCANPALAEKVEIHEPGLGAMNTHCRFVFHKGNVGNGITRCQEDTNMWWEDIDKDFRYGDEEYQLRKFDEVLTELKAAGKLQALDFVKIDVEGYECEVLKGAPGFIAEFSPRLIKTEVWPHLERCEPAEYLTNFVNTGYALARDPACTQLAPDLVHAGGDYYACKGR